MPTWSARPADWIPGISPHRPGASCAGPRSSRCCPAAADVGRGRAGARGAPPRTLQRLTARRIGLSPKWLIKRRRLHEAAGALRSTVRPALARIAADLGYSDQAHFTRDFRRVTGLTPGEYAAEPRPVEP
ncbi:MAG: helix-turn-helix domain-containing protein [Nocardioidaceae bacterium]